MRKEKEFKELAHALLGPTGRVCAGLAGGLEIPAGVHLTDMGPKSV